MRGLACSTWNIRTNLSSAEIANVPLIKSRNLSSVWSSRNIRDTAGDVVERDRSAALTTCRDEILLWRQADRRCARRKCDRRNSIQGENINFAYTKRFVIYFEFVDDNWSGNHLRAVSRVFVDTSGGRDLLFQISSICVSYLHFYYIRYILDNSIANLCTISDFH